ncbi:hypothetical protein CSUI_007091 [Cystoisospora suis]|uniref:Uncharacterized protein n=1 Tax=Cystoisospora suis TaxID=483139 RepID=A0A2C6KF07_9APIC|nr:hypothetical protein CSUI_007091 [Cystoisospora suis]
MLDPEPKAIGVSDLARKTPTPPSQRPAAPPPEDWHVGNAFPPLPACCQSGVPVEPPQACSGHLVACPGSRSGLDLQSHRGRFHLA